MGEYKKQITVIVSLIILIIILGLTSCSPVKRHARLIKRYPYLIKTDTIVKNDTIRLTIPEVRKDTVLQLDSFLVNLKDTIVIEKENLIVKITQIHDSIYVDAKCDTVFVDKIVVQKIPVKYYETVKDFDFRKNGMYALYIFLILLLLIILLKVLQFLKK